MEFLLTIVASVAVFGFAWIGLSSLLSALTGWSALAKAHRDPHPSIDVPFRGVSAHFPPFVFHAWSLTVGLSKAGLQLRIAWPFRVGHPPLLIPWECVLDRGAERGSFGTTIHQVELFHAVTVGFLGEVGEAIAARAELEERRRAAAAKDERWGPDPELVETYQRALKKASSNSPSPPTVNATAREALARCPYCLDDFGAEAVTHCPDCTTPHHTACLAEHGGCVVLACRGSAPPKTRA